MARFVVQLHDATSLHFDLRLPIGDALRSWAVPKGPSLDPAVRRLAVPVEDHSLSAGEFEGVRVRQVRGSGAVIIWDEGTLEVLREEPSHLSFVLQGRKLTGRFGLTRTGARRWVLVKARDGMPGRARTSWRSFRPACAATGLGKNLRATERLTQRKIDACCCGTRRSATVTKRRWVPPRKSAHNLSRWRPTTSAPGGSRSTSSTRSSQGLLASA